MKDDYLYGTPYVMEQESGLYHFNSDSELLGHFLRLKHSDDVLDIGTGSGVLLLYAAAQKPSSLSGIDLFDEVIEAAGRNLKRNGIEAQLSVCRIQDFTGGPYDAVICNPPYFETGDPGLVSSDPLIAAARHEIHLRPEELFKHAVRLMKDSGRLFLVHRAERLMDLLETAGNCGLRPVRMRIAYQSADGIAKTVLLEMRRHSRSRLKIEAPAFLDDKESFIL